MYKKTWNNVSCLIGDSCNTDKALSNISNVPLIDCARLRFNLAVKMILDGKSLIIEKSNAIMIKLDNLTFAAKRLNLTGLQVRTKNEPHWSSLLEMMVQYKVNER